MELFTRENFFGEGSERIDTVGVRGSKPLPRTIPKDGLLQMHAECLRVASRRRAQICWSHPIIFLMISGPLGRVANRHRSTPPLQL